MPYIEIERSEFAVLVRKGGSWGTFEILDGKLVNGNFYCACFPNAEWAARKNFMELNV